MTFPRDNVDMMGFSFMSRSSFLALNHVFVFDILSFLFLIFVVGFPVDRVTRGVNNL